MFKPTGNSATGIAPTENSAKQSTYPKAPLVANIEQGSATGITGTRLWNVIRRFFDQAADVLGADHPTTAEKLRGASLHCMRHTHASHAFAAGQS